MAVCHGAGSTSGIEVNGGGSRAYPLSLQCLRLYVPSLEEATHPRCDCEGYPDWPGRASSKEGES